ncbi:MAG: LPS biosynthesis choline kinase [Actinobacteria bacterium]|nr:MAG: LPS biosynthesis choline kinase [Actinomycetota bacterium]
MDQTNPVPLPDPVTLLDELEPVLGERSSEPLALDGGITNRNFRVVMGGEDYVLRICGKDTAVLGIDRDAECAATVAAAQIGVGPEVVAYRPDLEVLVTRWIEGRPATPEELRSPPLLEQVAAALRAVHAGPPLDARFDAFALVVDYRDEVRERGGADPDGYHEAAAAAARIAAALIGPDHEPVPCHNDLLPANFLHDGDRIRIVDWEYAGMGDRFFDLGNLAVNNAFGPDDEERLIAAYFGEPGQRRLAALRLMRVMSDFREAMWGAVQDVVSELDFDYAAYRDEHFERLLAAIRVPEFERSLADATAP